MSSKYGDLMDEFAQWGTNIKFNTALEEWMEDHCEGKAFFLHLALQKHHMNKHLQQDLKMPTSIKSKI